MSALIIFEAIPSALAFEMRVLALDVDLGRLKAGGADLIRYNLKEHPEAFDRYPEVRRQMGSQGEFLPIVVLDGAVVSKGTYPPREQLADWAGVPVSSGGCGGGGKCTCGG